MEENHNHNCGKCGALFVCVVQNCKLEAPYDRPTCVTCFQAKPIQELESNDNFILSLSIEELLKIDTSKLTRRQSRIRTLLLVYAKINLNCEIIGWVQMSDLVFDDLVNTVGDKPYQNWLNRYQINEM